MKIAILLLALFSSQMLHAPVTGMTDSERNLALTEFQRSKARFLKDVKGLSAKQLSFKADSTRWSIAQCCEHIALAESMLWNWMHGLVSQPANPEKAADVKVTDEQMLQMVKDRSHKLTAPEMLQPVGKFPSTNAAIEAFVVRRDSTIYYIKTTNDDLKAHITTQEPFGTVNSYLVLLLITGHSERHTLQIEEVMAAPGYPKQ